MDPKVEVYIRQHEAAKAVNRNRVAPLFTEVGGIGFRARFFGPYEIHPSEDVHGFYILRNKVVPSTSTTQVVHLQGYPGMSDEKVLKISARVRDYDKMLEERKKPRISPGNEHGANIAYLWERDLHEVPYDADVILREIIEGLKTAEYVGE